MSSDTVALFLDMMATEHGASKNTIDAYRRDILQFFEVQKTSCAQIKSQDIADFVCFLNTHAYAVKSVNRKLSAIREFCKFLYEEKILSFNPVVDILPPKKEKPLPKFLTPAQIEQMSNSALAGNNYSFYRAGVMIKLMFSSGLRISETVCLKLQDISFDKLQLFIKGKGSKERIVFFDENAKHLLLDYLQNIRPHFIKNDTKNSFVFASKTARSGHITRDTFFKNLKDIAVLCGISPSLVSPHTLRHSFATNLINHDVNLRSLQKMLGHENIATTEIYTHIASQKVINDVFTKHPLKDFKG